MVSIDYKIGSDRYDNILEVD